jgi:L-asparaginase II
LTVLLEVVRSGRVESWHRGSIVVLDPAGAVTVSAGRVDEAVLPRSSLKPLQAVAMVENGYPGRNELLALAAASHDGEDAHVAGARAILAAAGLDEDALQCPADLPSGRDALLAWVGAGNGPARVCHNCSGKHSAMLATCVASGWPTATYRDPSAALQQAIRARLSSLAGEEVSGVAVDGCGAPAFALGLTALARAFARLATSPGAAETLVREAMRAHPRMIGGTGRAVTELAAAVPGLVCKEGAEGVWGAALPDGRAFAAKLSDGSSRGLAPLLAAVVQHWDVPGTDGPVVQRWAAPPVLGGGEPVGAIRWSSDLRALLAL